MILSNFRLIIIIFILIGAVTISYMKTSLLNEVELVSGIGIDKVDDQYAITLQIFNPAANNKNAVDQTGGFTYTQTGKTIPQSIQKIKKITLKEPILDTLQVVILSEDLVKEEGLNAPLDYFVRDPRVPANINTIIIKGESPEVFLKMFTPQQKLSSLYTNTMLLNAKKTWGNLVNTSSERIYSFLTDKTSDITIPYVEIQGNVKEGMSKSNIEKFAPVAKVSLKGLASFKGDKLHSYLSLEETNTLALVKGINQVVSISTKCPNSAGEFTIETIRTSASLKSRVSPVSYLLNIKIDGNLEEIACNENLSSPSTQEEFEKQLERQIKSEVEALFKMAKDNGTDILGLKDTLYRQHPNVWKAVQDKEDLFSTVDLKTRVDVNFIRFGHTKH
ncbi:Ger(x)C family spore germination protein [Cytobacillus horneckiae]|uniref:Ger(x)C family spore germination protein n=1 Tax=Cytobacillus horneckiae TaxID=549687 RepID=UPI003D9A6870